MAFADGRHRDGLRQALEFVRTTVVGGALFLLPIVVVVFVLSKVFGVMGRLTQPVVAALGVSSIGGIAVGHLVTIASLVAAAFLAGLFARTPAGQAALTWIREGVSATIPQFSLIQDVARKFASEPDEAAAEMPVVLAPTDAGWALGLVLEAQGDWQVVFLPGSPQMSSGSVVYARADQIHRTDLTLKQLWLVQRGRGKGSAEVCRQLAGLQAAGKV